MWENQVCSPNRWGWGVSSMFWSCLFSFLWLKTLCSQHCSHTDMYSFLNFRDIQYDELLNVFESPKHEHLSFHKVQHMTYKADISSWTGHELDCFCFIFHRFLHELTLTAQQQKSSNCSRSVDAFLNSSQKASYSNWSRERHIPLYIAQKSNYSVLVLFYCCYVYFSKFKGLSVLKWV